MINDIKRTQAPNQCTLDVYFPLENRPIKTDFLIGVLKACDGISSGDLWLFYREKNPGELPKRVPVWFVNALWALAQDGMIVYRGDRVYSRGADL